MFGREMAREVTEVFEKKRYASNDVNCKYREHVDKQRAERSERRVQNSYFFFLYHTLNLLHVVKFFIMAVCL